MKIILVSNKYDYGKPERGLSFSYYNFYDTLLKMDNGIYTVLLFPSDEKTLEKGLEEASRELWEITKKEKPDLVFFVEGGVKKEIIQKITKSGIKTAIWMTDDHWQFEIFSKYRCFDYTFVATTDSQAPAKYHRIGYKNVIHTQWACNHFLYKPLNLPKIYDVTFVGAPHGNRKKIIQKIQKAGINVKCWGSGWQNGRVSQEDMIKIFSQSKINLNFTKSSGVFWKELGLVFLKRKANRSLGLRNPKEWLDHIKAMPASLWSRQIKGRNFEIPGCRGFCLTEYADNLKDYYELGKEIVCFENVKDLIEKIKYYLSHDREREEIVRAGYERTIRDHTYEKRFQEIFKTIFK